MVLGAGAFGGWLACEGGTQKTEISDFIKEAPETSLTPSAMWGHSKKMAILN